MPNHRNRLSTTVSAVASSGLGAFTISTAVAGKFTFGAGDDGLTFEYVVEEGSAAEVIRGVYTHSGTSLSRVTTIRSTTGSAIVFTAAAIITEVLIAERGNMLEMLLRSTVPGGRLTLTTGVPVTVSDVTGATSVYYTPHVHNIISLWDGIDWQPILFTEQTLALGTVTAGLPYDVFGYLSSGTLALEKLAWTSVTTRATGVTLQDGRWCKTGDKTRLLLGTFHTTSTTTTADSSTRRLVSNVYNEVPRKILVGDGTNYTYQSSTVRKSNNSDSLLIQIVQSVQGRLVSLRSHMLTQAADSYSTSVMGFGVDSSTAYSTDTTRSFESTTPNGNTYADSFAFLQHICAVGMHEFRLLENTSNNTSSISFYGAVVLVSGEVRN